MQQKLLLSWRERYRQTISPIAQNRVIRALLNIVRVACVIFIGMYIGTYIAFLILDDKNLLFVKNDRPLSEALRHQLMQNMTFVDKLLVIKYRGGYVNALDDLRKIETGEFVFNLEDANRRIQQQGICEFGGETVSMYAYYETQTILGLPHTEYVITCNYVQIKTYKDFLQGTYKRKNRVN